MRMLQVLWQSKCEGELVVQETGRATAPNRLSGRLLYTSIWCTLHAAVKNRETHLN